MSSVIQQYRKQYIRHHHLCRFTVLVLLLPRCPALFLAKDAVLSTFSVAKQTAIVVDSGYTSTTGTPTASVTASHVPPHSTRWLICICLHGE
jgi:hypothetical protein